MLQRNKINISIGEFLWYNEYIIIASCFVLDGQKGCVYDPGDGFYTHTGRSVSRGRQVIVPSLTFKCYGRIDHIVSVVINASQSGDDLPVFQIWRPSSFGSNMYNRIGQIRFPAGSNLHTKFYFTTAIPMNHQMEFQPGDVIGYYQPSSPHRLLWSIKETGYVSYSNNASSATATIDTSNIDYVDNDLVPFFRVFIGEYG